MNEGVREARDREGFEFDSVTSSLDDAEMDSEIVWEGVLEPQDSVTSCEEEGEMEVDTLTDELIVADVSND